MGAEAAVTQLRRGAVEHCVLALLETNERYGYDLVSQLTTAGLVASEGTVYPLLSRLRKDELVETHWRDSTSGPPRRYYALTRPGQRALDDFRVAWADFSKAVESILRPPTTRENP
jgi:PadR family transcriptional regulator PadR